MKFFLVVFVLSGKTEIYGDDTQNNFFGGSVDSKVKPGIDPINSLALVNKLQVKPAAI
jgi:hypothetical protein